MDGAVDRMLKLYETGMVSRRGLVRSLAALALGVPLGGAVRPAKQDQAPIQVLSLNHVTCFVSDIPRTVEFYRELFGMPVLSEQGTGTNLQAGPDTQFVGIYGGGGANAQINHLCLGVADFDVDRITGILEERGIEHRVRMRDDTVPEIYLSDPDGLQVQLQDVSYCGGSGPLGNVCA